MTPMNDEALPHVQEMFWNKEGEQVEEYQDSWQCHVLEELTSFAHALLSRRVTDLSGEEVIVSETVQMIIPDVMPRMGLLFLYDDNDLKTVEAVKLINRKHGTKISIDLPPPAYSVWEED